MWNTCADTVRKQFEQEPGVMVLGSASGRGKRGYRVLRIPESVLRRVYQRLLVVR
jgi:hypothetical protein